MNGKTICYFLSFLWSFWTEEGLLIEKKTMSTTLIIQHIPLPFAEQVQTSNSPIIDFHLKWAYISSKHLKSVCFFVHEYSLFKSYKAHISWIIMALDPYNLHQKNMFSTEDPGNPSGFQLRSTPGPPQCGCGGVGCGTAGAGGAGGGTHEALDAVRHRSHGAAGLGGGWPWEIGLMDWIDGFRFD